MEKPIVNVNATGITREYDAQYKIKVLKANIPFADQVTEENTKYIIRWNFDLDEEEVEIPANCILQFEGGSLNNGTIVGQKTILRGEVYIDGYEGVFTDETGLPLDKELSNSDSDFSVEGVVDRCDFGEPQNGTYPLAGYAPNSFVAVDGYFVTFGYIKENNIQHLYCAVFDYDYNRIGYNSLIDGQGNKIVAHAQGATVKDGYIYVTNNIDNDRLLKVAASTLLDNVRNGILQTEMEVELIPQLGESKIGGIHWDDFHKRWAFAVDGKIFILNEGYVVISSDEVTLLTLVREFFPQAYAIQDIIYDGYFVYGTAGSFGQSGSVFFIYDVEKKKIVTTRVIINRTEVEGITYKDGDIYIQGLDYNYCPILKRFTERSNEVFTREIYLGKAEFSDTISLYVDNSVNKDGFGDSNFPFKYLSSALYYARLIDGAAIYIKKTSEPYKGFSLLNNNVSLYKWGNGDNPIVYLHFYIKSSYSVIKSLDIYELSSTCVSVRDSGDMTIEDCKINGEVSVPVSAYNSRLFLKNTSINTANASAINADHSDVELAGFDLEGGYLRIVRGTKILISGEVSFKNCSSMFGNSDGEIEASFSDLNHVTNTSKMFSDNGLYNLTLKVENNNEVYEALEFLNSFDIVPTRIGKLYIVNATAASTSYGYTFKRGTFDIGGFGQSFVSFQQNPLRGGNNVNINTILGKINQPLDLILKACSFSTIQNHGFNIGLENLVNWSVAQERLRLLFPNGMTAAKTRGTTAERPIGRHPVTNGYEGLLYSDDVGFRYFDTTIMKPIYARYISPFSGTITWVDANGGYPSQDEALKIAILGESISTYAGTSPQAYPNKYPWNDVQDKSLTWWMEVCNRINGVPTNCSWNGSHVVGYPKGVNAGSGCSDIRIQDIGRNGTPDIIFVFIGANDWGNEISLGTWSAGDPIIDDSQYSTTDKIMSFSDAYALMISKLKTAYPTSSIYCFTCLDDVKRNENPNLPPCKNGSNVSITTWNDKIKEIAQALSVGLIDTHECGVNYSNASDYLPDGLHLNANGMVKLADYVINQLSI